MTSAKANNQKFWQEPLPGFTESTEPTVHHDDDSDGQTFRLSRKFRNTMLMCAVLFAVFLAMFVFMFAAGPPPDGRPISPTQRLLGLIVFGGFWAIMLCGSLYYLLLAERFRLTIHSSWIKFTFVRSCQRALHTDVTELEWRSVRQGIAVVQTQKNRTAIHLENFNESDRLNLIHRLRSVTPENRQKNWHTFHDRFFPSESERKTQLRNSAKLSQRAGFGLLTFGVCSAIASLWLKQFHLLIVAAINAGVGVWYLRSPATQRSKAASNSADPSERACPTDNNSTTQFF